MLHDITFEKLYRYTTLKNEYIYKNIFELKMKYY